MTSSSLVEQSPERIPMYPDSDRIPKSPESQPLEMFPRIVGFFQSVEFEPVSVVLIQRQTVKSHRPLVTQV